MKQAYLKFPNNEWAVIVVFDFDVDLEYEELQEQLRSFGMKPYNIKKALRILSNYNTGMAVSNDVLKMSAIYISKATSPSQFWDSCAHELAHVVVYRTLYAGDVHDDSAVPQGPLRVYRVSKRAYRRRGSRQKDDVEG